MLEIRLARPDEFQTVKDFYWDLIEKTENSQFQPGWQKGVYPTDEFLMESLESGELYVGFLDGELVTCMIVNHKYNDGYNSVKWSVDAADDELVVIHALGVDPDFSNRGIAKEMVKFVIDTAKKNGLKTIRLDVLGGNIPAEKAYTKMGFKYLKTLSMFYEDTGWTDYMAFELIL